MATASPAMNIPSRGYLVLYRLGAVNHCPGCSRSHWHVGRTMAECAYCSTAVSIKHEELRA
ncbi:hypothetical protein FBR43_05020 [Sphingomonas baiyangensis]|uniref:Uncharacterized protein n=1 Tax=Sphingomonas baiyangensis TaxID=2572576 RepID=A0A4U1L716_9SPHN|nr:hypothetical protein FBR43_05020 [Sphingomonas baiyangensis]